MLLVVLLAIINNNITVINAMLQNVNITLFLKSV